MPYHAFEARGRQLEAFLESECQRLTVAGSQNLMAMALAR